MLPNKSFNILYWSISLAVFLVYVGLRTVEFEQVQSPSNNNLVIYSHTDDFIVEDRALKLLDEYRADERKILQDEKQSVEVLATIFEKSLARAVEDSVFRMSSPEEDMIMSFYRLIKTPSKVYYSKSELRKMKGDLEAIAKAMAVFQAKGHKVDSRFLEFILTKNSSISGIYKDLRDHFSKSENVRCLKDFVVYSILGVADPQGSIESILDNKALEVHNKYETFVLRQELDKRSKKMDSFLRYKLNEFLKQPRWNLWAPQSPSDKSAVSLINLVGVGGSIEDAVVERRASNIVRANSILRDYIRDLESV